MSHRPLRVVALSGGLQRPSRTLALTEALVDALAESTPIERRVIELGTLVPHFGAVLYRTQLPAVVEDALAAVESADLLIATSPVYRGSYSGLFKHFFDFVHQDALVDKHVLLAATGGSDRHALVIDHQLRPLFSFFQAHTLPIGVYATDRDFEDYRVHGDALRARIALAVERAVSRLGVPALAAAAAQRPALHAVA